jgi:molecular chaperone GrpE (heat shock protein)
VQIGEQVDPLATTAVNSLADLGREIDLAALDTQGLAGDVLKAKEVVLEQKMEKAWQAAVALASAALGKLTNQGLERSLAITAEWDESQKVTSLPAFDEENYREATEAAAKIPGLVETLLNGDTEVKRLQADIEEQKKQVNQRMEQIQPGILTRIASDLMTSSEANFRVSYLTAIGEEKDAALNMAECTHKAALQLSRRELARIKNLLDAYDQNALNALKQRIDNVKTDLKIAPIPEILPKLFEELEASRKQLAVDAKKKGPACDPDLVKLESKVSEAKLTADAVKLKREAFQLLLDGGDAVLKPLNDALDPKAYRGEFADLLESLKQRKDAETETGMDALVIEYNTAFKASVEHLAQDSNVGQKLDLEEQGLVTAEQAKQRDLESLEEKLNGFGNASLFKFVYLDNLFNNADTGEYKAIKKELDSIKKAKKDAPEYRSLLDRVRLLERRRDALRENVQGAQFASRKQFAHAGAKWNAVAKKSRDALGTLSNNITGTDGVESSTSSKLETLLNGMKDDLPQGSFDEVVSVIANEGKPLKDRLQAREEGLRLVRHFKSLLPNDPFVARVSNTPFEIGVDYVPVYRTLDDLDLNLRVMVSK